MMTAEIKGLDRLINRLDQKPKSILDKVASTLKDQLEFLAVYIQNSKLSGQLLNVRSGDLKNSIQAELTERTSDRAEGRVYSAGTLPYARIQNDGGVINHPGSSKFQVFQGANGLVFTRYTRPHTITITGKHFMESGLEDRLDEMRFALLDAAQKEAASS